MKDMKTDTLEQIAHIVWTKLECEASNQVSYDQARKILAIAIKSPEAAKYWVDQIQEAMDKNFENIISIQDAMYTNGFASAKKVAYKTLYDMYEEAQSDERPD